MKMTMKIPYENYMITLVTLITLKYLPKLYQQILQSLLSDSRTIRVLHAALCPQHTVQVLYLPSSVMGRPEEYIVLLYEYRAGSLLISPYIVS